MKAIKTLDDDTVKWIAMLAMTIDHVAFLFLYELSLLSEIMHFIGRLVAPLMCYFLVVGYTRTKNVWRYFVRLMVFALLSQPIYVLFLYLAYYPTPLFEVFGHLNILFNLAFALFFLQLWGGLNLPRPTQSTQNEHITADIHDVVKTSPTLSTPFLFFEYHFQNLPKLSISTKWLLSICFLLSPLATVADYGRAVIFWVLILAYFYPNKHKMAWALVMGLPISYVLAYGFHWNASYLNLNLMQLGVGLCSLLIISSHQNVIVSTPAVTYQHNQGKYGRLFYWFYPIHLLILCLCYLLYSVLKIIIM